MTNWSQLWTFLPSPSQSQGCCYLCSALTALGFPPQNQLLEALRLALSLLGSSMQPFSVHLAQQASWPQGPCKWYRQAVGGGTGWGGQADPCWLRAARTLEPKKQTPWEPSWLPPAFFILWQGLETRMPLMTPGMLFGAKDHGWYQWWFCYGHGGPGSTKRWQCYTRYLLCIKIQITHARNTDSVHAF